GAPRGRGARPAGLPGRQLVLAGRARSRGGAAGGPVRHRRAGPVAQRGRAHDQARGRRRVPVRRHVLRCSTGSGVVAAVAAGGAAGGLKSCLLRRVGAVSRGEENWPRLLGFADPSCGVRVSGPRSVWPGPLDVSGLAVAGVREAACAAASLAHRRGASPGFTVDSRAVAAALASLDRLRVDGRALQAWAGLSGFFPTGDGWVRLHANYPHHRRALLSALSVGAEDDETAAGLVRRALADMTAVEAEDQVRAAGGVAAAVRAAESWRQHPQGSAVLGEPLVAIETTGVPGAALGRTGELPLSGLRVLDLTRVIAGPV